MVAFSHVMPGHAAACIWTRYSVAMFLQRCWLLSGLQHLELCSVLEDTVAGLSKFVV